MLVRGGRHQPGRTRPPEPPRVRCSGASAWSTTRPSGGTGATATATGRWSPAARTLSTGASRPRWRRERPGQRAPGANGRRPALRVDLGAVAANTRLFADRAAGGVMAVVKADGFGHGALAVARTALANGAAWLGVASIDEALALRAGGLSVPGAELAQPRGRGLRLRGAGRRRHRGPEPGAPGRRGGRGRPPGPRAPPCRLRDGSRRGATGAVAAAVRGCPPGRAGGPGSRWSARWGTSAAPGIPPRPATRSAGPGSPGRWRSRGLRVCAQHIATWPRLRPR